MLYCNFIHFFSLSYIPHTYINIHLRAHLVINSFVAKLLANEKICGQISQLFTKCIDNVKTVYKYWLCQKAHEEKSSFYRTFTWKTETQAGLQRSFFINTLYSTNFLVTWDFCAILARFLNVLVGKKDIKTLSPGL